MRIDLTEAELKKCQDFAYNCAKTMQEIEFGQTDTAPRGEAEIGRDHLIGKMAEVAFAKMLKQEFQQEILLDFDCYDRGKWDTQDAELNGWKIDIKATRQGGRWMLIEWNKLDFRQKEKALPHLFVMASVGWERESDKPTGIVTLEGSMSTPHITSTGKNVKVLRKGECIPNTNMPLQADNFGIEFKNLKQDWHTVIPYILKNESPNLDSYPNPYTGQPLTV